MRLEIQALFGLYDSGRSGAVSAQHMRAALAGCGLDQAEADAVLRRGGVIDEGHAIGAGRFEALMEATGIWY
jgi:Ca2+-binding EF-hand superfamily protein